MTKIAISPNVSGTGTFTIAAPDSNTDRTLTLPDAVGSVVLNEGSGTFKIDSTGNVGVGTASPTVALDVVSPSSISAKFSGNSGQFQGVQVQNNYLSGSQAGAVFFDALNENGIPTNSILFSVDADGQSSTQFEMTRAGDRATDRKYAAAVLQPIGANETLFSIYGTGGAGPAGGEILNVCRGGEDGESYIQIYHNTSSGSGNWFMGFNYGVNPIGSISQSGTTGVSYNTSSDYRLKEDVQPMVGASERVLSLKPVNFAWKADGSRVDGFLAHEAQAVVPEAVHGTKDEVDADGKPVYQGIDQSKLVPLLTAALQEALADIATLKAEVAALKGASA